MASFDTDIVNYTEEQIRELAIKILKDFNPDYFAFKCYDGATYNKDNYVWYVSTRDEIFDASEFLTISDETGEPIEYQNFNMMIFKIVKDANGKYKAQH